MVFDIPNIRHLRGFREVAHCHSITAAAEREHLSQPAITQAIAKLESTFGVALFDRRSDGMFATPIGALFVERVGRALDHLQAGARDASRLGNRARARGFRDFDRLLTVAQLRALVAMSDASNFSMAARNLGVSQPTIHRAARNLERLSGLTLFEGSPAGITLTPAAQALAQHTKLAFSELRQGFDEIGEFLGRDSTHIVIGSLPLARTFILPRAIDAMVREKAHVQIRVVDGPYDELLHSLRDGDIDCMIGALRAPPPVDDVVQEKLFDDPLAIVAGNGHPLSGRQKVTLDDTLRYPWVAPPKTTPAGSYLFNTLKIQDLPETPVRVVTSSLVLMRGLLTTGPYITIISLHQIRHEHRQGLLVPLPIDLPDSYRAIGLTYRQAWRPTRTQSAFLANVREAAAAAHEPDTQHWPLFNK